MKMFSKCFLRAMPRMSLVLLVAATLLASSKPAHAVVISTTSLPNAQFKTSYTATIQTTDGNPTYKWTLVPETGQELPPGLNLNNSGEASTTITGTPTALGTYDFTVKVVGGSGGSTTAEFSITVQNDVSVSGNELLINGTQGTLNGFTFIGFANTSSCASTFYTRANQAWGTTELSALQNSFHGNTVRLQVALDLIYEPTAQNFNQAVLTSYIASVAQAVALARSEGLIVIVSMQWEAGSSGSNVCDGSGDIGATLTGNPAPPVVGPPAVPGDNAAAAWTALLGSGAWTGNTQYTLTPQNFLTDTGVLLEIYNEPSLGNVDGGNASWNTWSAALQPLVDTLRTTPIYAKNVLIIPGLTGEKILDARSLPTPGCAIYNPTNPVSPCVSSYMLSDDNMSPAQLVYAVHPYPVTTTGTSGTIGEFSLLDWNDYFGTVAQTMPAPVIVTEWFTGGIASGLCWSNDTAGSVQPPSSPVINNYPNPPYTFSSATIAPAFMSWLATAAPTGSKYNNAPMSLAGAWPFDEAGYNAQDLVSYDPTTFPSPSAFLCNTTMTGGDGTSTYPGPGSNIATYFNSY
jgi:Putative Ig domain/Cellulase (glycosyl hydrolase family 5)